MYIIHTVRKFKSMEMHSGVEHTIVISLTIYKEGARNVLSIEPNVSSLHINDF